MPPKKRKKPTETEARAAVGKILVRVFDVPAVLRGTKPLKDLSGLVWVFGALGCIGFRLVITTISSNMMAKMAGSLYLRDSREFAVDLSKRVLLSAFSCSNSALSFWFRRRIEIEWQKKITDDLHSSYFQDSFFYRQTLKQNPIPDPGQRIVRDVMMLTGQLTRFCQSSITCTLEGAWAVLRLIYQMPDRWYYAPLIIVVQWLTIRWRNWFNSALHYGMQRAKFSQISGMYRDAHSRLASSAEAIISYGGVAAESSRIRSKLNETLKSTAKFNIISLKDNIAMNVSRDVIGMTMTYALVHVPLLSASHPLKEALLNNASEELRMQANAGLLSHMTFTMSLVRDVRGEVGQLLRSGRTMMQLSGYAMRIGELLDETDSKNAAQGSGELSDADADGSVTTLSFNNVDVKTPTGIPLVDALSFAVAEGQNLMVCGANGVGKTSICRTLKGIWAAGPGGQITCSAQSTAFLPQTPYFPLGSLQDAVAYPNRLASALAAADLRSLLEEVKLEYLLERESVETAQTIDWNATLSLGEKQQLAIGRMLLNKPTFAVLDEATSAIEGSIEQDLFETLQERGVTVITVTHSASLLPHHQQILKIKGETEPGGRSWSIKAVEEGDEAGLTATPRGDNQLRRTVSADDRAAAAEKKAAEVSKFLAARSAPFIEDQAKAGKPMPVMSDLKRTIMLFRTVIEWENLLMDRSLQRMACYLILMAAGTWVSTGYLSGIPGALQALVIQSEAREYFLFQVRIMAMRLVSMALSSSQLWVRSGVTIIWRERMTRALTDKYISHNNFYTMKHVDKRVTDADTRISQEVSSAVMNMNYVIRMIVRPLTDAVYCTVLLVRIQLPFAGLLAMWGYGIFGLGMIRLVAPDFAHLKSEDDRVMANFRGVHDRVMSNSESIAFLDGGMREEAVANGASASVLDLLNKKNNQRAIWNACEMFLLRRTPDFITQILRMYWSFGQGTDTDVLAVEGGTKMAATSQFIGSLIEKSFDTFSSLLGIHEEVQELFGSCRRVSDVWLVLEELEVDRLADLARVEATEQAATPRRGERICLTGASIVAPDGSCLAKDLSFSVESTGKSNLLITGPNGCGKSSVARVLSKVWSVGSGSVVRPSGSHLAVIPQSVLIPTLPLSLLDLLTYPTQLEPDSDAEKTAVVALSPLMTGLRVGYLIERNEEGWHAVRQWDKVLSMGEEQCLAFIRLLYHQPKWAVLDEPVSAMSEEMSAIAFAMLQERKVNYVTISQSDALMRFHSQWLRLGEANAEGWSLELDGWSLTPRAEAVDPLAPGREEKGAMGVVIPPLSPADSPGTAEAKRDFLAGIESPPRLAELS